MHVPEASPRSPAALAATTPGDPDAHPSDAQLPGRWAAPPQPSPTSTDAAGRYPAGQRHLPPRAPVLHPAAAKVIATLSNEWDGLARHRDLPQLPLDNNTAERALRTPVIGRKNFYGSGAQWAARLAADIWTVTATAARHDIEPLSMLTSYLRECARNGGTAPAGAPGPLPALDTPRTRPPSSRRRSGSRPVIPAIRSPAKPAMPFRHMPPRVTSPCPARRPHNTISHGFPDYLPPQRGGNGG